MVPSKIYTYFGVHDDVFCCFTVSNGITISDRLLLRAFKESTHYGRFRFVFKIVPVFPKHFWIGSSYVHIWQLFPTKSMVSLQNSLEQLYTTTIDPPLFRSNCSIPKVYIPPSVAATVRHTADQQSIEFAAILPHRLHFLPGPSHIVPTHHDKLITQ